MSDTHLSKAVHQLNEFFGEDPLAAIRRLESSIPELSSGESLEAHLEEIGFSPGTVTAALEIKRLAGQVNVLVHASGIVASLPYILEPDERIMSLSLGAGNTGKDFDLITDRRVAEFKFISWRGGAESIRQNQVFQDYLKLLWDESGRRKQLFLTGTKKALRFLSGGRALDSVLSKNALMKALFVGRYGSRFRRVGEFFEFTKGQVEIIDLRHAVPIFAVPEAPSEAPPLRAL